MNALRTIDKINAPIVGGLCFLFGLYTIYALQLNGGEQMQVSVYVLLALFGIFTLGAFLSMYVGLFLRFIPDAIKLVRFALVGVLNTLVDIAAFTFLATFFNVEILLGYILVKVIAFVVANANSFLWNKLWVFDISEKSKKSKLTAEIVSFYLVSTVGLFINALAFAAASYSLPSFVEASALAIGIVSVVFAAMISMLWNFFGYKTLVFEKK